MPKGLGLGLGFVTSEKYGGTFEETSVLLLEDGCFLLLETGFYLILE